MYKKSFAKQHKQQKSTSRKNKSEGASAVGEDDQHQSSFDGRSSQMKDDQLMFGGLYMGGQGDQGQGLMEEVDRMFENNNQMQMSRQVNLPGGRMDATNVNNNNSLMVSENMLSPMKSSVTGSGKGSKGDNVLEQSVDLEQETNRQLLGLGAKRQPEEGKGKAANVTVKQKNSVSKNQVQPAPASGGDSSKNAKGRRPSILSGSGGKEGGMETLMQQIEEQYDKGSKSNKSSKKSTAKDEEGAAAAGKAKKKLDLKVSIK